MKVLCECGASLDVPALDPAGGERILFCVRCRGRTRVERRPDGRVAATRLARPEVDVRCSCGLTFKAYPPDTGGVVRCEACGREFVVRKEKKAKG